MNLLSNMWKKVTLGNTGGKFLFDKVNFFSISLKINRIARLTVALPGKLVHQLLSIHHHLKH